MKFLKVLLIILGAFVVILVIMGLVGPKTYQVERSAVITASPDVVWPYTSSSKAFQEWSPFRKMDTTAVIEYFGDDGAVGSGYRWKGKKSGKGESTFTTLEPGKSSLNHLLFYTPFGKMESDSYMNLEPDPGGTKITWGIKGTNNFVGRIMSSMMNMEKEMSPVFDEGLADLQTLVASRAAVASTSGYQITTGDYQGGKYLAIRDNVKMTEISNFYQKNIPLLMAEIDKSKLEMAGVPSGIYYTWDEEKGISDMAAVVPFKGEFKAPAGMQVITLPAGHSLGMDYQGGYSKIGDAHMSMEAHMKNNNIVYMGPVLEEYYVGPGTEPDSNKWMTKIVYLVK
ncbi:MAG TPA: SRPBCC family protein [Saprospiraceae bacterium]|nr:SRPBCC family protein [Saprospiraceae bacterium]